MADVIRAPDSEYSNARRLPGPERADLDAGCQPSSASGGFTLCDPVCGAPPLPHRRRRHPVSPMPSRPRSRQVAS